MHLAQNTPPHLRQWCLRSNVENEKVLGNVAKDENMVEQEKVSQELDSESRFQSERAIRTARCSFGRIKCLLDAEESVDTEESDEVSVLVVVLETLSAKLVVDSVGEVESRVQGGAHDI